MSLTALRSRRHPTGAPSRAQVEAELQKVLDSATFTRAERLSGFLRHTVQKALDGQPDELREYLLGVEVFGRGPSFDQRTDTIVRVEARRLRNKLEQYYDGDGRQDPLIIRFERGSYVPAFVSRGSNFRRWRLAAAGLVFLAAAALWLVLRLSVSASPGSANAEARSLYLKARYYRDLGTGENVQRSLPLFEQSVARDSHFAPAHSGMADAWATLGFHGLAPPNDAFTRARIAAGRALELDPKNAQALGVTAWIRFAYDWDWSGAENAFRNAIECDPKHARVRVWYAFGLASRRRFAEALDQVTAAAGLDSAYAATNDAGTILYFARRYGEAISQAGQTRELNPGYVASRVLLGKCLAALGRYGEAIASYRQALGGESERYSIVNGHLGRALALAGRREEAQDILTRLEQRGGAFVESAMIDAALGENTRALTRLNRARERHDCELVFLGVEPGFDELRQEPGFAALLSRLRL